MQRSPITIRSMPRWVRPGEPWQLGIKFNGRRPFSSCASRTDVFSSWQKQSEAVNERTTELAGPAILLPLPVTGPWPLHSACTQAAQDRGRSRRAPGARPRLRWVVQPVPGDDEPRRENRVQERLRALPFA